MFFSFKKECCIMSVFNVYMQKDFCQHGLQEDEGHYVVTDRGELVDLHECDMDDVEEEEDELNQKKETDLH